MKILIADDNEHDIVLARMLIKNLDPQIEIVGAETLEEAMILLLESHKEIAMILLDVSFPGKSGLEFLRAIKAESMLSKIPTVMLSGYPADCSIMESYRDKANFFVEKPLIIQKLKFVFSNIISLGSA